MKPLILLLLGFCFFSVQTISQTTDNVIIYLPQAELQTLDPGKMMDLYSTEVGANVFEGLVRYKNNSVKVVPCLATNWEISENGKRWVFYLRKGVRFHNGEMFDSSCVLNSLKRRMEKKSADYKKWEIIFPFVSNIKPLDKYTVEFSLTEPYIPFLNNLVDPVAAIVAPEALKESDFKPIGTGPFKFKKWEKRKHLVLQKNDEYWGKKPKVDYILYKFISDSTRRTLQIKNGRADVSILGSANEYDELLGKKNLNLLSLPSHKIYYLAFNTKKNPFNSIKIRRAFSHLIKKEILIPQIFQKFAKPATVILPPHIFGYNNKIKDYIYNPKKAKQLLEIAGYRKGFKCSLYYSDGHIPAQKIANNLVINARKVNITIEKKPLLFEELIRISREGKHDMMIISWAGSTDPDKIIYPILTMEKGNLNDTFYENTQLTKLLKLARKNQNIESRRKMYYLTQEIIHRDIPLIPLCYMNSILAKNTRVKNLYIDVESNLIFRDAYISD